MFQSGVKYRSFQFLQVRSELFQSPEYDDIDEFHKGCLGFHLRVWHVRSILPCSPFRNQIDPSTIEKIESDPHTKKAAASN